MFGGLEIKGAAATASKDGDGEPDPTPDHSVPAAPSPGMSMSSFGFMNVGAPAEPMPAAPAPAAVSSFSFLNPTAPEPAPVTVTAPATPTPPSPAATATATATAAVTSGFSFMMPESTTTTTTDPAVENPAPPSVASSSAAADASPSSGFDFMNSMATSAAAPDAAITPAAAAVVEESIIPTIAEETPAAADATPAASGGFWSLTETPLVDPSDGSSPAVPPAMPTTVHTRNNSFSSVSSALSANSTPAQTGGLIAGVTFGTSSAKPRIKKKKKRTARVGVGANHNDTAAMTTPAPIPAPVAPTTPVAKDESKSARDAALEASNRAEAFMQAKAMEDAKLATETKTTTTKTTTTAVSSSAAVLKTESAADFGLVPTESTDDVMAAAKEAAEQAKTMQHQQKGKGFMGTFFKGFRASPHAVGVTRSGSMGNSSKHSIGSNSSGNAMDRLTKEQQVMKQAMQQQSKKDDDDDDEVVVTTSVGGGYTPATAEPMEYTSVTDNADAITKTTISEGSAFVPASIPKPLPQKSSFSFMVPSYGEPQAIAESPVPVPVAPTVKIDNSPKQIFIHHQEYFSDSVNRAMKKVEDTRNLKKGLLEERFVALAKDRFATREIEQIEELLQAAIDEEDYEEADELGQKLDAHKREKSEVANMLANNKSALEQLESENTSLGELVVSCFEDLALRLGDLKKKEAASEKKDDNETLTQYASISKQLSAEHERLQQDLKHLERDEQLVGEERKELENSIKDQTGEIETQREESSSKLTEVEKEIEELRNALQMKQKEAADLRTKMFGFEDSISKVRVKFSRQLTRVDKKEISLKESRREWEIENQQHKRQKDAHDHQVQTHSDTLLAHEELTKTLESELKLSKEFSQIIPTQLGFMDEESESEEKDDDDEGSLAQLKANVVKCEGAIDVAKKTLKMASMAIQNLQSERDMLVARIPELETQKKAAATGREFRAAAKFSKEIKDDTARIKVCEEELNGDTKAKKASAEANLRQLDLEFLEAKKIADAREKLSGEKRMKILGKKIAQLVKEKVEKCGESKSEGCSVKSVAARVLGGQIMVLVAEGQEIGSKYGGWDELMTSVDLDDKASTSSIKGETQDLNNSSVEQGDGQEKPGGGLTSEERLAKIKELLAKCSEMEMKVEEAADREDFEAAGELQETLDKINVEIEELDITDEECELLAGIDVIDAALDTVPPEQQQQEECGLTNEERLTKAKELMTKQIELEQKVEEAAEGEDFEAAEELQTTIDQITVELKDLNITDEEQELLAMEGAPSDAVSVQEEAKDTIPGVEVDKEEEISAQEEAKETISDVEEEKKEGDEEKASDLDEEKLETGEETSAEKEETNDFEKNDEEAISDDESKPIEEDESPEQVDAADADEV
jgi:hypothetical protein